MWLARASTSAPSNRRGAAASKPARGNDGPGGRPSGAVASDREPAVDPIGTRSVHVAGDDDPAVWLQLDRRRVGTQDLDQVSGTLATEGRAQLPSITERVVERPVGLVPGERGGRQAAPSEPRDTDGHDLPVGLDREALRAVVPPREVRADRTVPAERSVKHAVVAEPGEAEAARVLREAAGVARDHDLAVG